MGLNYALYQGVLKEWSVCITVFSVWLARLIGPAICMHLYESLY